LGWLTFLSPPLANYLSPYNMAPGIVMGVQRWKEQASAAVE
jgi:hypothetical protein